MNLQPFLAIETTELLVVHDKSLTAHQHEQAAIAEAAANHCKLAQPLPHSLVTRSLGTITNRASIRAKYRTRPPFAHIETAAQMSDDLSPCGGRKRALGTRAPLAIPQGANQRWSLDFLSDALTDGRRFRILAVVDDFTRECLALVADTSLPGLRVVRELDVIIA